MADDNHGPIAPGEDPNEEELRAVEQLLGSGSEGSTPFSGGPPASSLPEQNLDHDRYDRRLWREILESSAELSHLQRDEEAPATFPALLEDLFLSYFKAQPDLLPETGVEPRHRRANRPFVERALDDPDTYRARATTSLDVSASALSALAAGERLLEEIKNRPSLEDYFDEAAKEPPNSPEAEDEPDDAPPPPDDEGQDGDGQTPPDETTEEDVPADGDGDRQSGPELPGRDARRAVRAAADAGREEAENLAGALSGWGLSPADLKRVPLGERSRLLKALSAEEMRRLIDLVGKMRFLARQKAQEKVRERRDEVHSIELSGDLSRLLPSELALLASPQEERSLAALGRLARGESLSWELRGKETEKKGPLIAAIDCCLTGETKVLGPQGTKRMDELEGGDLVYSYVDGRLEHHEVRKAWFTKRQDVLRVRTSNRALLASPNHPFLRLRETSKSPARFAPATFVAEWARADQLRRGDRVVTLREVPDIGSPQTLPDGTPLTEEVAWLIGLIVGDGWVKQSGFAVCVYGEIRERVADLCRRLWRANGSRTDTYGISIHSVGLRDVLRRLGLDRPANEKRLPAIIWNCPDATKRAFLDGYRDADGHEGRDGREYHSSSQDLISEVRTMHIALGDAVSNIRVNRRTKPIYIKGKRVDNPKPLYTFVAYRTKRRGLSDGHVPAALRGFSQGPFAYQQVLSVETIGERDTYDIEVEGSHNFAAEGMVVHNSGSMGEALAGSPHKKMEWATAVALGLADLAAGRGGSPKRAAAVLFFNARVAHEVRFAPGERDARKLLDVATVRAGGGTRYEPAIERALEIARESDFDGADLVLVTDELCRVGEGFLEGFLEEKERRKMRLFGVLIGHASTGELGRYSDHVWALTDLAGPAMGAAGEVFGLI